MYARHRLITQYYENQSRYLIVRYTGSFVLFEYYPIYKIYTNENIVFVLAHRSLMLVNISARLFYFGFLFNLWQEVNTCYLLLYPDNFYHTSVAFKLRRNCIKDSINRPTFHKNSYCTFKKYCRCFMPEIMLLRCFTPNE